jgi:hypothetical protein
MKWIFLSLITLLPPDLLAAVYKCELNGVTTFSQTPCANDAEEVTIRTQAISQNSTSDDELEQACLRLVSSKSVWKDPLSIRIEGSRKSWVTDDSGHRRVLTLFINAKNSYGAYGGPEPHICFLNHSGTGLSKIQHLVYMPAK